MTFIATRPDPHGNPETLGMARVVADPDNLNGEFILIVRSDLKTQGLGEMLMNKLIAYCRMPGIAQITANALSQNNAMVALARKLHFEVERMDNGQAVRLCLELAAAGRPTMSA